jgi:hypothetical protein
MICHAMMSPLSWRPSSRMHVPCRGILQPDMGRLCTRRLRTRGTRRLSEHVGRAPPALPTTTSHIMGPSAGDELPTPACSRGRHWRRVHCEPCARALDERRLWNEQVKEAIIGRGSVQGFDDLVPADIQVFSRRRGTPAATRTQPLATCQSRTHQSVYGGDAWQGAGGFALWLKAGLKTSIYYLRTKPAVSACASIAPQRFRRSGVVHEMEDEPFCAVCSA